MSRIIVPVPMGPFGKREAVAFFVFAYAIGILVCVGIAAWAVREDWMARDFTNPRPWIFLLAAPLWPLTLAAWWIAGKIGGKK